MSSKVKAIALCIVLPVFAGTVSGCASSALNYPSTSGIDKLTQKTLSPNEQKAVIDDLQRSDDASTAKPLIEVTTDPS